MIHLGFADDLSYEIATAKYATIRSSRIAASLFLLRPDLI